MQWNIIQLVTCDSVSGHLKGVTPRERQVLYDAYYMWNLESWTHRNRVAPGGCQGLENREMGDVLRVHTWNWGK